MRIDDPSLASLLRLLAAGATDEELSEQTNAYKAAPLPAEPTLHLPGTPGKVRVMACRARRRERLFHPLDARLPPGAERHDLEPEE